MCFFIFFTIYLQNLLPATCASYSSSARHLHQTNREHLPLIISKEKNRRKALLHHHHRSLKDIFQDGCRGEFGAIEVIESPTVVPKWKVQTHLVVRAPAIERRTGLDSVTGIAECYGIERRGENVRQSNRQRIVKRMHHISRWLYVGM